MSIFADPSFSLRAITVIASSGLIISTVQMLWNWREFRDDGLLSWDLCATQRMVAKYRRFRILDALFGFPGVLWVIAWQSASAVILLASSDRIVRPAVLAAIMTAFLLQRFRHVGYPTFGSDGMYFIVFGALSVRELAPESRLATQACLWFIALQSCLSYTANGLVKLKSASWRHGGALRSVAHHPVYGNITWVRLVESLPGLEKWVGWSVVGFELAFPLALLGPPACWILLACGLCFHAATAVFMGLNMFLFAWFATYPAILFVALR